MVKSKSKLVYDSIFAQNLLRVLLKIQGGDGAVDMTHACGVGDLGSILPAIHQLMCP